MSEPEVSVETGLPLVPAAVPEVAASNVPFFLVGTWKFVALCVVTFSLYQVYWFYQQWRQLRDVGCEDIWPILRTAFAGLFSYWLFDRVAAESDRQGVPGLASPFLLAGLYFVAISSGYLGAPVWAPMVGTIAILGYVQSCINALPAVQALEPVRRNARFSKLNWAGAAACAVLIALILMPDTSPLAVPDDQLKEAALALAVPQQLTSGVWLERVEVADVGLTFYVRLDGRSSASRLADLERDLVRLACQGGGIPTQALTKSVPVHFALIDERRVQRTTRSLLRRSECPIFD